MEPDKEMLENLDLLLEMDVLEEESSWDILENAEISVADLEEMEADDE